MNTNLESLNDMVKTMTGLADGLLAYVTECPKCGISWRAVDDSLREGPGENRAIALTIIDNCDVCALKFRRELEVLTK